MFSGYSLAVIEDPGAGSLEYKGKGFSKKKKCPPKMTVAILFLLATNIPMALYMSLVHQVSCSLISKYSNY
jgi:GPI mannosyltransferase 3